MNVQIVQRVTNSITRLARDGLPWHLVLESDRTTLHRVAQELYNNIRIRPWIFPTRESYVQSVNDIYTHPLIFVDRLLAFYIRHYNHIGAAFGYSDNDIRRRMLPSNMVEAILSRRPPPSYEQSSSTPVLLAPPPSYQSLYGNRRRHHRRQQDDISDDDDEENYNLRRQRPRFEDYVSDDND